MKKLLATALLLTAGLSTSAHAGFISGTHVTDGGKTVNLQGLEWMPLTYTAGLSRDQVEAAGGFTDRFGGVWNAGDWRYATRAETAALLGSLWGGTVWGSSNNNADGALWFLQTFGALEYDINYGNDRVDVKSSRGGYTNFDSSIFYLGANGDCDPGAWASCIGRVLGFENSEYVQKGFPLTLDSYEVTYLANSGAGGYFTPWDGLDPVNVWPASVGDRYSPLPHVGSLLVRNVEDVPSVSSPSAISLFVLGLGALLLRRRKTAA